jgi:hypothetical protein
MTVGHSILLRLRTEVKINFDVVVYFPYNVVVTSNATLNKRWHCHESAVVNMSYLPPPATRHFLSLCSYCCASLWSTNSPSLHINILYKF